MPEFYLRKLDQKTLEEKYTLHSNLQEIIATSKKNIKSPKLPSPRYAYKKNSNLLKFYKTNILQKGNITIAQLKKLKTYLIDFKKIHF